MIVIVNSGFLTSRNILIVTYILILLLKSILLIGVVMAEISALKTKSNLIIHKTCVLNKQYDF